MKKESLLVVDDEPVILHSLARKLVSAGCSDHSCERRYGCCRNQQPFFDLVTTDLAMPGLDEFQALKAAKGRSLQTMYILPRTLRREADCILLVNRIILID